MNDEAERLIEQILGELDNSSKDREPKLSIGPRHLQFMGVDFLKPTCKNPKSRDETK